jgi:hypothetical protein
MKGSPLERALVLLGVLLLLGWPLQVLTRHSEDVVVNGPVSPLNSSGSVEQKVATSVVLTFSKSAKKAVLKHLGKEVWVAEAPAANVRVELSLPFPKEGIELGVDVEWEGEGEGALRLQLNLPDGSVLERTVWGAGSVETVVPFP